MKSAKQNHLSGSGSEQAYTEEHLHSDVYRVKSIQFDMEITASEHTGVPLQQMPAMLLSSSRLHGVRGAFRFTGLRREEVVTHIKRGVMRCHRNPRDAGELFVHWYPADIAWEVLTEFRKEPKDRSLTKVRGFNALAVSRLQLSEVPPGASVLLSPRAELVVPDRWLGRD